MTSEVLLMNLSGAALAADSAVTMIGDDPRARRQQTIYTAGVRKIFPISRTTPMAGMVYGNGAFAACPWDVVFQAFEEQSTRGYATLTQAMEALAAFLAGAQAAGLPLGPHPSERKLFSYVQFFLNHYFNVAFGAARLLRGAQEAEQLGAALQDVAVHEVAMAHLRAEILMLPEGAPGAGQPRGVVGAATPELTALLEKRLSTFLRKALQGARFPLPDAHTRAIAELIVDTFLIAWLPPSDHFTGVVIAGFGGDERTPSYHQINVWGAIGGVLKYQYGRGQTTGGENQVVVDAFALDNPIKAFINGIHTHFRIGMENGLRNYLAQALRPVLRTVQARDAGLAAELVGPLERVLREAPVAASYFGHQHYARDVHQRLSALWGAAGPERLADFAVKLLEIATTTHALTGDQSVARPITSVYLTKRELREDVLP